MRQITNRLSTALTVNQGYKWHFATHQVTNRQKKHSKMRKNGDDGHPTRSAFLGFGHCAAVCGISSLSVLFCAEMASFLGSQGHSLPAIKVGHIWSHVVSLPHQRSNATIRCIGIAQLDRYACATVRPSMPGRGVATGKWIVACAVVEPPIATAPAQISSAVVPHVARCRSGGQPWRTSRCDRAARTLHVCMCSEWHKFSGYLCMRSAFALQHLWPLLVLLCIVADVLPFSLAL